MASGGLNNGVFAPDTNGPVGQAITDVWFGITDTWGGPENPTNAEITGTWSFDISSATGPLEVHADMMAMNAYAGSTVESNVDFFYQIDGGGYLPLFTSSIAFGESQAYTMDGGATPVYDDPVNMATTTSGPIRLTDVYQTLVSPIVGNGNNLDIQVRVNMDGSESFVLDNLRIFQVSNDFAPDSFTVEDGVLVSGGIAELAFSDDADLSIRKSFGGTRTEFQVKGVSPVDSPSVFDITFEGSVTARGQGITQIVELFDYDEEEWEVVDSRFARRFELTVEISPGGDLSRFVQAGTRCIEARVSFEADNPRMFASNTDQFIWTILP